MPFLDLSPPFLGLSLPFRGLFTAFHWPFTALPGERCAMDAETARQEPQGPHTTTYYTSGPAAEKEARCGGESRAATVSDHSCARSCARVVRPILRNHFSEKNSSAAGTASAALNGDAMALRMLLLYPPEITLRMLLLSLTLPGRRRRIKSGGGSRRRPRRGGRRSRL